MHLPAFTPNVITTRTGLSKTTPGAFSHDRFPMATPAGIPQMRRCVLRRAFKSCATNPSDDLRIKVEDYLSSPNTPKEGPLAFETLKKCGREDIISAILQGGGSETVALALGLDRSLFIPPLVTPKSTMLDDFGVRQDGASLKIGRALENRLDTIEQVQKGELSDDTSTNNPYKAYQQRYTVPSPDQLVEMNKGFGPPIVDDPIPLEERITMPISLRVGMISLTLTTAIGFGRASDGIIPSEIQQACQAISCGLMAAHIALAVYTGSSLAPSLGRSSVVWFGKVLLSGPLGFIHLRAAGPIESE